MVDINLGKGAPTINNDIELIIQQVDLLFDTKKKELMGVPGYGADYEQFLFNMQMSNEAIAYQLECDLGSLNLFGFEPHVEVSILEGTLNDIILCKVELSRNDEVYEKTYAIQ